MLLTDGLVLVGTDAGLVYAFEQQSGAVRWKFSAGAGVPSDIVQAGQSVFAVSLNDELLCLDVATGRDLWRFQPPGSTPERHSDLRTGAAVAGGLVFFAGQDGNLYGLDGKTGEALWIAELGAPAATAPRVAGNDLYLGTEDGALVHVDWTAGEVRERIELGGRPHAVVLSPSATPLLFVRWMTPASELIALGSAPMAVRWRKSAPQAGAWNTARPFVWRGTALAGTDRGEIRAFRLADGAEQWAGRLEGEVRVFGGSDDTLYVGTVQGRLYAVRPPS